MDNLDGLTDEQLLALIRQAEKPVDKTKQKVKVQTINGEVLEADSHEALNQLLLQRLAAAPQGEEVEEPAQPQTQNQPKLPKFDYKKFEETFVKDPVAGQEYLETTQYGMPLKQLLPQIGAAVGVMAKKLQELETQSFIDQTEGYEPSKENRKAIEQIMTERGWSVSRQTLDDAFAIASSKGLIKAGKVNREVTKTEVDEPWTPPRTRSASEPLDPQAELVANLDKLTDQQIFELAEKAGIGPARR